MTLCENCGNNIPEDTIHALASEGNEYCLIKDKTTGISRGYARKKPPRDLYRKKH